MTNLNKKITRIFKMKNLFTKNYWAMKGLAMLVLVVMVGSVKGQTTNLVSWDFTPSSTDYSSNTTNQTAARTTALTNTTLSTISIIGGATAVSASTFHRTTAWPTTSNTGKYLQFSITLNAGQTFTNNSVSVAIGAQVSNITSAARDYTVTYGYGASPTFSTATNGSVTGAGTSTTTTTNISIPAPGNTTTTLLTVRILVFGSISGSGNFRLATVALTGFAPATATPSIAISNGTIAAGTPNNGQTNVVLQRYDMAVATADATLTGLTVTTGGTYAVTDLTNLKCWYEATSTFNSGTATLLSTKTTSLSSGSQVFPSFTSQAITSGNTGYIFLTADIASGATNGNTINIATTAFSNISFTSGTKTGTDPVAAAGIQTITVATNNWTGATSTSWNNTGNWSLGTVPLSTDNITISSGSPILDVDYTLASGRTLTISGTGTLTINPTKILTIAGTADFGGKSVTLKSDANGTASIGQITGTLSNASNVTVERYIPATRRAYRFLAAPVTTTGGIYASWQESGTNATGLGIQVTGFASATPGVDATSGLDKSLTGSSSMFTYNGTTWLPVTDTKTTQLTPGAGFRVLVRGDRMTDLYASSTPAATATTIKATGTLGQGTITLNPLVTGFNLLGNPYPSSIDWNASGWQTARNLTNVYDAIYIYDPAVVASTSSMTYPTYLTGVGGSNNGSNIIRSGQAFFVNAAASASISFLEAYKSTTVTGGFFRSALPEFMRVTYMQNNEHLDDIIINFNDDAQAGFDPRFDAISMGGDANGLASFKNADRLAIHTRPTAIGEDSVALSVRNTTTGNYQLKFSEMEGFAASTDITLLDKFLNVQYDVKQDSIVAFEITTDVNSKGDDRFWLFYNHKSTGINQQALAKNKINVYPNPASSVINLSLKLAANQKSTYSYNIYNQLGAMVQAGEVDFANGKQAQINIDAFSPGVYFITASNGKDLQTIKFVK